MKKSKIPLLLMTTIFSLAGCGDVTPTGPVGDVKTIYVDGGGDIGHYNTTASMTKSDSNPFPYNTLEKLCDEWSEAHPGYKVKINKTSAGGDRSILEGQLKMKNACHIIYQNGNMINSDLGKDYYVNLTPYLEKESPYLNGKPWKSVYNEDELAATQASDGDIYYVNMEKIPVCFMYNKTILKNAGVDVDNLNIQTLDELTKVMEKVQTWVSKQDPKEGYGTYGAPYTWYQLALETNMYSDLIEQGDVLRKNGIVDTEELCRLFNKGIYQPSGDESNRLYQLISLIKKLDTYKVDAAFSVQQGWNAGKLAFMEGTGQQLRSSSSFDLGFEWSTFAYPDVSLADYSGKQLNGVVRGIANLATSWWVTNTAMEDGTVEQCVDLLQFLTAPEQNNRMVGDLKGGIPLNPSDDMEIADYLKPLAEQYNKDREEGNRAAWTGFSPVSVLGKNFSDSFIRKMQDLDKGTVSVEEAASQIAGIIKNTIAALIVELDYDITTW